MPDHRIQPPRNTPGENLTQAWDALGDHIISLKELWPTLDDYRGLRRSWRRDLLAGLTVGIVALPLALGFGVASGAGAAAGLVTASSQVWWPRCSAAATSRSRDRPGR